MFRNRICFQKNCECHDRQNSINSDDHDIRSFFDKKQNRSFFWKILFDCFLTAICPHLQSGLDLDKLISKRRTIKNNNYWLLQLQIAVYACCRSSHKKAIIDLLTKLRLALLTLASGRGKFLPLWLCWLIPLSFPLILCHVYHSVQ